MHHTSDVDSCPNSFQISQLCPPHHLSTKPSPPSPPLVLPLPNIIPHNQQKHRNWREGREGEGSQSNNKGGG
eukprot:15269187-Ditylum_brightwellii.AAC.1